ITADDQMRSRMLKAAKKYIEEADPGTEKWLSLNMRHFPAEVGYKSLRLLQDEYPQALLTLTPERWAAWTPILLHYFWSGGSEFDKASALVAMAYETAPVAVRE